MTIPDSEVVSNITAFLSSKSDLQDDFADGFQLKSSTNSVDLWKVGQNVYYIIVGLFIIVADSTVWLTIVCFKKLRSHIELLIIATWMVAETFYGIAYFSGGIWRLSAALDVSRPDLTPFECMQTVHATFFIVAPQFAALIELAISIDRLICVLRMSKYVQMDRGYLAILLAIPGIVIAVSYGFAWYSSVSLPMTNAVDAACMINSTVSRAYYLFYNVIQVVAEGASVVIYGVVICIFVLKRRGASVFPANSAQAKQLKRQRKVTKTLGMMSLLCFVTYLLPQMGITLLGTVYQGPQEQKDVIVVWMRIIMALYSVCNVIIYLSRPSEATDHIRFVFRKYILRRKSGNQQPGLSIIMNNS